jgi:hypothetical protein
MPIGIIEGQVIAAKINQKLKGFCRALINIIPVYECSIANFDNSDQSYKVVWTVQLIK